MKKLQPLTALICVLILNTQPGNGSAFPEPEELRGWIEEMKVTERGPFTKIRWFCKDGTVDGQAAESVRINLSTGKIRLLAQATEPYRRVINATGGVDKIPASGADRVLTSDDARLLIKLAQELPARLPQIKNADGTVAPVDIEFGFADGNLVLFQIRPFLENAKTHGTAYLNKLDAHLSDQNTIQVDLNEFPGTNRP